MSLSLYAVLSELLIKVQQSPDDLIIISHDEVRTWSNGVHQNLLKNRLLKKVSPASSLVCDDCEENCLMPVHVIPELPRAFIICASRDDTSRVPVDLSRLEQWKFSHDQVINCLHQHLNDKLISIEQLKAQIQQLPLQTILMFKSNKIWIDKPLLISCIIPASVPEAQNTKHNSIVLKGDYWCISFNGVTRSIKNTLGIRYIEYLIRNQDKEIHVSELYYAVNPPDINQVDKALSDMSKAELETTGLSIGNLNEKSIAMTPDSKQLLQNHLKDLSEKIEDAIELGVEDLQGQLEDEQEKILQQLAKDYGLAGKPRQSGSLIEQLRKNITNCINKDKKKLQETFPEFAAHLVFIQTGTFCRYGSNPDIEWQ